MTDREQLDELFKQSMDANDWRIAEIKRRMRRDVIVFWIGMPICVAVALLGWWLTL